MSKRHRKSAVVQWLVCVALVLIILVLIFFVWLRPMSVADEQMSPTLQKGDIIFYSSLTKHLRLVERSDMIAVRAWDGSTKIVRVIATEGNKVEVRQGVVFVNGKYRLDEHEYISWVADFDLELIEVPKNYVYALPDNRELPPYSAEDCLVQLDDILGVVRFNINDFTLYN